MSRTVRRTKHLNWVQEKAYTHEVPDEVYDLNRRLGMSYSNMKRSKLPEPEYSKKWWWYHADNYHFTSWRGYRSAWGDVRTQNRNNLVRYLRDSEKECFFWEDINTKDWE